MLLLPRKILLQKSQIWTAKNMVLVSKENLKKIDSSIKLVFHDDFDYER